MGVSRINFRDSAVQRGGYGRSLLHVVLLLAFLWLLGFLAFVAAIPVGVRDPATRTDAIVVLTGGGDRLAEAFRLLEAGMAPRLLITGVAQGVNLAQVIDGISDKSAAPAADLQACCITLGYQANSTLGNAAESAAWVRANNVQSVRLVTANYHIQRSRLEFRRALPEIELVLHPVYPREVQDAFWFVKPRILLLLMGEYHKFVGAWLRGVTQDGLVGVGDARNWLGGVFTDWSWPEFSWPDFSLPDWAELSS